MSSSVVRTQIKSWLVTNASSESVVDLTSQFDDVKELLAANDIQPDAPWLGIEFIGDVEEPISLAATNVSGSYREYGAVQFHAVDVAKYGISDSLIARLEAIQNKLRGIKVGEVVNVVDMTLPNTTTGAVLDFESGFMSASFLMHYYRDINL